MDLEDLVIELVEKVLDRKRLVRLTTTVSKTTHNIEGKKNSICLEVMAEIRLA